MTARKMNPSHHPMRRKRKKMRRKMKKMIQRKTARTTSCLTGRWNRCWRATGEGLLGEMRESEARGGRAACGGRPVAV